MASLVRGQDPRKPSDVTVLVPSFNNEETLEAALDSVLSQSFTGDLRVLLVDDASEDNSPSIVERFSKKFEDTITSVSFQENQMSQARRPLFLLRRMCPSRFIAFCDADDSWATPLKLEEQIDSLLCHPAQVALHTDVNYVLGDGFDSARLASLEKLRQHPLRRQGISARQRDLIRGNFIFKSSAVLRSEAFHWVFSKLKRCNSEILDWVLWLLVAEHGEIGYLSAKTTNYLVRHSSWGGRSEEERARIKVEALNLMSRHGGATLRSLARQQLN